MHMYNLSKENSSDQKLGFMREGIKNMLINIICYTEQYFMKSCFVV